MVKFDFQMAKAKILIKKCCAVGVVIGRNHFSPILWGDELDVEMYDFINLFFNQIHRLSYFLKEFRLNN